MNKYHAHKTTVFGIDFDSKVEAERYLYLLSQEQAGHIENLETQPKFILINEFEYRGEQVKPVTYKADFRYTENGKMVVEDVKGVKTREFIIKEKLFKLTHPYIDFRIVK